MRQLRQCGVTNDRVGGSLVLLPLPGFFRRPALEACLPFYAKGASFGRLSRSPSSDATLRRIPAYPAGTTRASPFIPAATPPSPPLEIFGQLPDKDSVRAYCARGIMKNYAGPSRALAHHRYTSRYTFLFLPCFFFFVHVVLSTLRPWETQSDTKCPDFFCDRAYEKSRLFRATRPLETIEISDARRRATLPAPDYGEMAYTTTFRTRDSPASVARERIFRRPLPLVSPPRYCGRIWYQVREIVAFPPPRFPALPLRRQRNVGRKPGSHRNGT